MQEDKYVFIHVKTVLWKGLLSQYVTAHTTKITAFLQT